MLSTERACSKVRDQRFGQQAVEMVHPLFALRRKPSSHEGLGLDAPLHSFFLVLHLVEVASGPLSQFGRVEALASGAVSG